MVFDREDIKKQPKASKPGWRERSYSRSPPPRSSRRDRRSASRSPLRRQRNQYRERYYSRSPPPRGDSYRPKPRNRYYEDDRRSERSRHYDRGDRYYDRRH